MLNEMIETFGAELCKWKEEEFAAPGCEAAVRGWGGDVA